MKSVVMAAFGLALLSAGVGQTPHASPVAGIPRLGSSTATCAAFSPSGERAIAWAISGVLSVALTPLAGSGTVMRLKLPPAPAPNPDRNTCKLAFSRDGERLAVAVQEGSESDPLLRVEMIDAVGRKLLHGLTVNSRGGTQGPFSLIGFLTTSHAIAIATAPENLKPSGGISHVRITTLVFRHASGQERPKAAVYTRVVTGISSSEPPGWMDAAHNRLWYLNDPHFCPMRTISLTGSEAAGPIVGADSTEADICERPGTLLYPGERSLVALDSRDQGGRILRASIAGRHRPAAVLRLPRAPARASAHINEAALSPDGQAGALSRNILSYGFFDIDRDLNDDLVVFQVRPLRMLAHLKAPRHHHRVDRLAVDSRNGRAILLVCWDGTWMRYEIPIPGPEPGASR